jgi:hypothetical protein
MYTRKSEKFFILKKHCYDREVLGRVRSERSIDNICQEVLGMTRDTGGRGEISDASALHYTNPGDDQTILF